LCASHREGLAEERRDKRGDLGEVLLQGEVAGVESAEFGARQIA
jgi:hypothetical protein